MAPVFFPPALKPKGTVGIVSPARWPEPQWLEACRVVFERRGYRTVLHPQNYLHDGQLAGSDAARTDALMEMFRDPSIDAILTSRGGSNAIRIVDRLDYDEIKRNPKPFIGFSDISLLLNAITQQTGMVTYHGPMAWNFANNPDPRVEEDFFAVLQNASADFTRYYADVEVMRQGSAEGILVGGNLTRLELLMSTAYDWSAHSGILFLEDVDEVLYKIDEKLRHLRLAGRFNNIQAIIIGEMVDIGDGETGFARPTDKPFGRTLRQIFLDNLPPDIPLCFDFPCGHGRYLTTLPLGARVRLTLGSSGAELTVRRG